MVTTTSELAATWNASGSVTTSAPLYMVVDALPPLKVSSWIEPGTTLPAPPAASVGRPTVAWPMVTAWAPNSLENRSRTPSPPSDACTIMRTDWLVKPTSEPPVLDALGPARPADQEPAQPIRVVPAASTLLVVMTTPAATVTAASRAADARLMGCFTGVDLPEEWCG